MHDPFAAAVALDPSLVRTRAATVDVELAGTLTRGMTVADWTGKWGRRPNVDIARETDPNVFFELLIGRGRPRRVPLSPGGDAVPTREDAMTARDAAAVTAFWRELGLPGLVDVHTHFMPDRVMHKVGTTSTPLVR